jgi:hypothetical protein
MENKCKFFAWILLQENNLMADNLQKKGWPLRNRASSITTMPIPQNSLEPNSIMGTF